MLLHPGSLQPPLSWQRCIVLDARTPPPSLGFTASENPKTRAPWTRDEVLRASAKCWL